MVHVAGSKAWAFELSGVIRRSLLRRFFDILFASAVLTATAPLLLLAIVAIVVESPGSPFFLQRRLGLGGRPFDIIKLRTMIPDAESSCGPTLARKNDPRITAVGWFLRKTHIDELPQFINVLRGEMAIVGPRPERPELYTEIIREVPAYSERLRVEPGITGLAQTRGDYHLSFKNKLRYDLLYIEKQSFGFDMKIVAMTILTVITMRGSV